MTNHINHFSFKSRYRLYKNIKTKDRTWIQKSGAELTSDILLA